jgi:hypothetical protein
MLRVKNDWTIWQLEEYVEIGLQIREILANEKNSRL